MSRFDRFEPGWVPLSHSGVSIYLSLSEAVLTSLLLYVAVPDGEALRRLIHFSVAHGRLAGSTGTVHRFVARGCLLLPADVSYCRVEVCPEGLRAGHVLLLEELVVALPLNVLLVVDIGGELLARDVVHYAVQVVRALVRRVCAAHVHWRDRVLLIRLKSTAPHRPSGVLAFLLMGSLSACTSDSAIIVHAMGSSLRLVLKSAIIRQVD